MFYKVLERTKNKLGIGGLFLFLAAAVILIFTINYNNNIRYCIGEKEFYDITYKYIHEKYLSVERNIEVVGIICGSPTDLLSPVRCGEEAHWAEYILDEGFADSVIMHNGWKKDIESAFIVMSKRGKNFINKSINIKSANLKNVICVKQKKKYNNTRYSAVFKICALDGNFIYSSLGCADDRYDLNGPFGDIGQSIVSTYLIMWYDLV